jgi:hypothetical protein
VFTPLDSHPERKRESDLPGGLSLMYKIGMPSGSSTSLPEAGLDLGRLQCRPDNGGPDHSRNRWNLRLRYSQNLQRTNP